MAPANESESAVARGPHTSYRGVSEFDGPLGPPPALLGLTVTIYALCSVALIGFGILALVVGQNWQLFWFCVLIALYCGALAWAGSRIRSESPGHRASAWLLAPVLLHALVGLAGTSSLLWVGLRAHDAVAPGTLLDVALTGSMLGMVFGWAPALSPLFYGRRGGWFFLAALSGPGLLVALVLLGEQRWM